MSRKEISYYLDQYQSGHYSYKRLLRKIDACNQFSPSPVSLPRIFGCFHIYLRPESFRFGFHLFLPLFLLRPAIAIARKKLNKKNTQPDRLPKPMLKHLIRLLKSRDGRFHIDIASHDGTRIFIKNGSI